VSATFVPKEKVIGSRRHSTVHAAPLDSDLEGGLEAMKLAEDYSNPVGTRRRSFESNFKKKGGMKNNISGKLVIVITDSGVGLSRINLKRLFKEVLNSSNLYEHNFKPPRNSLTRYTIPNPWNHEKEEDAVMLDMTVSPSFS
jgi:hypothetical protein